MNRFLKTLLTLFSKIPIPYGIRMMLMRIGVAKFFVGVVLIVINSRNEVLLLQHTYRRRYPWGLPSGWLKSKENPIEAMKREVIEETKLSVDNVRMFRCDSAKDESRLDLIFVGKAEGSPLVSSPEISDARFFKIEEFPEILQVQLDLIREATNELKLNQGDVAY